jgi:hypothetical protein
MESEFSSLFHQINYEIEAFIQKNYLVNCSVKERFLSWWLSFARFSNERPFDLIYMDELTSSHLYPKMGKEASTSYYMERRAIYQKGIEEGLIQNINLSWINQFVRSAITNVIKVNIAQGGKTEDEQLIWMVEACWNGIKV